MWHFKFIVKAGVWLKDVVMLPSNLAKATNVYNNLKIQQQLSETQHRLEEAENQLAQDAAVKAGRMFFRNNVVWAKEADGQIEKSPYCPRCFELNRKPIHLITWDSSVWGRVGKCIECKCDEIPFREPQ